MADTGTWLVPSLLLGREVRRVAGPVPGFDDFDRPCATVRDAAAAGVRTVVAGDPFSDITLLENPDNVLAVVRNGALLKDNLDSPSKEPSWLFAGSILKRSMDAFLAGNQHGSLDPMAATQGATAAATAPEPASRRGFLSNDTKAAALPSRVALVHR
jgi:hypothetical protein